MTDCTVNARLCKPRRVPTPSGRFRYFHAETCPARPGAEIHYGKEHAQGRRMLPRGWRGVR